MPNSEAFERLLQKALQSHDCPPVPAAILRTWQHPPVASTIRWVWLSPLLLFTAGLLIGSMLAPIGFDSAFRSIRLAISSVLTLLPDNALSWALLLLAGVLVLAADSLRELMRRRRREKSLNMAK